LILPFYLTIRLRMKSKSLLYSKCIRQLTKNFWFKISPLIRVDLQRNSCLDTTWLRKVFATVFALTFFSGKTSTHLVKQSITTNIYSLRPLAEVVREHPFGLSRMKLQDY